MNKNKLIAGFPGTGKTANHLFKSVEESINNHESLLIIDNSREYLTSFKSKLEKEGYIIKTIDLKNHTNSDKFNIFEYPYKLYQEKNYDDVINILDCFSNNIFKLEDSSDPFWSNSASDLFKSVVLSLFESEDIKNITLDRVQDIISHDLKEYFSKFSDTSLAYKVGEGVINAPTETKGGIISVCSLGLGNLTHRLNLLDTISNSTISFDQIKDEKIAIVLLVDDMIKSTKIVANIILYELYYSLYKNNHNPYNIIIDDISFVERIENLDVMVKNSRNNKIFFNVSVDDLDVFNSIYGEYTSKLFDITNLNNK